MFNTVSAYSPQTSPAEALNNGTLPFVGRRRELEFLESCWKRSLQSQSLQTALVVGETGIGKSRLVEQFIAQVRSEGATVVHIKLPVDSSGAIAPYILRACRAAGIKEKKGESPGAIAQVLRRHIQLRPTVVVIEDIDLLKGASLYDFALFVETLIDERLLLVSTARPCCQGARSVLELYPLEEVTLGSLSGSELTTMLEGLFGERFDPMILEPLEQACLGNPLAIRSALRGLIRTGALHYDPSLERWVAKVSGHLLENSLRHNVDLLVQGMAVSLDAIELQRAAQLAVLGRTFSRRTAAWLVDGSEKIIERLLETGLASTCRELPSSLSGEGDVALPVTFTNTLVHRFLSDQAVLDSRRLISAISHDLPLFSPLPFEYLSRNIAGVDVDVMTIRSVVLRALDVAVALDRSASWDGALPLWECASALALSVAREEHTLLRDEIEAILLGERILLMRRFPQGAVQLAERVLEITEPGSPIRLRPARLAALGTLQVSRFRESRDLDAALSDEISLMLADDSALQSTRSFVFYAEQLLAAALESFEVAAVDRCVALLQRLGVAAPPADLPPAGAPIVQGRQDLLQAVSGLDLPFRIPLRGMAFLLFEGKITEAIASSEQAAPYLLDHGLLALWFESLLNRLTLLSGRGIDAVEIDGKIQQAITTLPVEIRTGLEAMTQLALLHAAVLRADPEWRARLEATPAPAPLPLLLRLMMAVANRDVEQVLRLGESVEQEAVAGLAAVLRTGSIHERESMIDSLLDNRPASLLSLLRTITAMDIVQLVGGETLSVDEQARLRTALGSSLTWLAHQGLSAWMLPLLERNESLLVRKEALQWRARISQLEMEFRAESGSALAGPTIMITMLESIQTCRPGEEPVKMRGARLSIVLGLMVADPMLETPLTYSEFCQLASDGESNPDRARDTVNGAVYRLRGLLGGDAILTDAETPRLNPARVQVDLIEAYTLLTTASRISNEGALMHAIPPLLEALRIVGGRVPFPGLYDNFFEATREDFEHRLRTTVLSIAGRLLRDGEVAGAEEALRAAFEGMPEDEEIATLLCDAMILLGKRTEAERVRMRLAKANAA